MRVEYCPGLGMANGKTMMEILLMDALDHHLGLDQLRLEIFFNSMTWSVLILKILILRNYFKSWKVKIIKQFMDTGEPVKYGQCWVFSGLLTTLMRSIGIPARSVTNFASAHDTENTMTIDKFIRNVCKHVFQA